MKAVLYLLAVASFLLGAYNLKIYELPQDVLKRNLSKEAKAYAATLTPQQRSNTALEKAYDDLDEVRDQLQDQYDDLVSNSASQAAKDSVFAIWQQAENEFLLVEELEESHEFWWYGVKDRFKAIEKPFYALLFFLFVARFAPKSS